MLFHLEFFEKLVGNIRRGARHVGRTVKKKVKKLHSWAKKEFYKAKHIFDRYSKKLKEARKAHLQVKKTFKIGLKVFNYIRRHGIRGIINIRRLWFDVSLESASLGRFAGGINMQFFGRYNLNLRISFNLRKITDLAQQLFRKVLSNIKRIFG